MAVPNWKRKKQKWGTWGEVIDGGTKQSTQLPMLFTFLQSFMSPDGYRRPFDGYWWTKQQINLHVRDQNEIQRILEFNETVK